MKKRATETCSSCDWCDSETFKETEQIREYAQDTPVYICRLVPKEERILNPKVKWCSYHSKLVEQDKQVLMGGIDRMNELVEEFKELEENEKAND